MSSTMVSSTRIRIDLANPNLSRIDIRRDLAEPLASIPRFGGHRGERRGDRRIWSVGQHCVVGAKAMLEETDDVDLAFAFLLHDAHEALIGDMTTPTRDTIVALCGPVGDIVDAAIRNLKLRLDTEIHRIAGLRVSPRGRAIVHAMDMRMLATEARQILGVDPDREPAHWPADCIGSAPVRTNGALSPWPTKRVEDEWMALWDAWRIRPRAAA